MKEQYRARRMKNISYRDVPNFYNRISSKNSKGNLIPAGGNCSLNRSVMFSNALSQIRPILHGEVPNFDTIQSYDIQQSKKNITIDEDMTVMYKFDKVIDGNICDVVAYILLNEETKTYHYCEIPKYVETGHGYGVLMKNDIESYKDNKIHAGDYITRTNSFNDNLEYEWGVNAVTALTIDSNTIEDAGLISDTLSDKMTGWTYDVVEFNFDADNDVLKNIYGDANTYKSLPSVGDEIKNEIVYAIAKGQKTSQYFKTCYGLDAVDKSDIKAFAKGKVVDIEIRQQVDEIPQNIDIANLREDFESYERNILETMNLIMDEDDVNFTKEFMDRYNFLDAVYNKKMIFKYDNKIYSKKNVHVKLTIVNEIQPLSGQKITGRCGNKFTVADIFHDGDYYTDTGKHIEYLGNGLALPNRAIMEPAIEMYMNKISEVVYQYILNNKDKPEAELQTFVKDLLDIFNEDMSADVTEIMFRRWNEFMDYPYITWYIDSYESGVNIKSIYKSFVYLAEHGVAVTREKLYKKSEEGGKDIYLGSVFVSKLFIMPLKQTAESQASIRGLGTYDSRGVLIRTNSKRKRDTPVKQSPLVTDILCNLLHEDDLKRMNSMTDQESVQIANAYLQGMGLHLHNPNLREDEE